MNKFDSDPVERDLQTLRPAKAPAALLARLEAALRPAPAPAPARRVVSSPESQPWTWLRWVAPATVGAALVIALLAWKPWTARVAPTPKQVSHAPTPAPKVEEVELDRQLVDVFDAIARLPDGERVRFRCREWSDDLLLRDSASGVEVEKRAPRLEIIPIRFETY